ncbi:MAG: sodium:solute symporter family transporter, partial [Gemmatimonadota bacterium]
MSDLLSWALLAAYGLVFVAASPSSDDAAGFYAGRGRDGRSPGDVTLFATVFISWIFAKSVTNSANLAAEFGLPGAVAYGAYWLAIPVAGVVVVALRSRFGARSLPAWVAGRYGRMAAGAFLLALLIRLYNEVWSNTAVVATYFGPRQSAAFYAAALAFTALTLLYTLKGGLRSSIFTDGVQAALFGLFLVAVVAVGLPASAGGVGGRGADLARMASSGSWTLSGGLDLALVAVLQSLSYPFHDPVLTDRGFIAGERATLRAFLWAGVLGFVAIVLFGTVGLPAHLEGLEFDDDAPRVVAAAVGSGALLLVNVVMLTSAGSTLDSAFSSIAKAVHLDGRRVLHGPRGGAG